MAKLEATIQRWIGTSTETKPRPGMTINGELVENIPPGSSFYEEDTEHIARWTGVNWTVAKPEREDPMPHILAILEEVRAGREEARTGIPVATSNLLR